MVENDKIERNTRDLDFFRLFLSVFFTFFCLFSTCMKKNEASCSLNFTRLLLSILFNSKAVHFELKYVLSFNKNEFLCRISEVREKKMDLWSCHCVRRSFRFANDFIWKKKNLPVFWSLAQADITNASLTEMQTISETPPLLISPAFST